jgi:hypothetical protein
LPPGSQPFLMRNDFVVLHHNLRDHWGVFVLGLPVGRTFGQQVEEVPDREYDA